MKTKTATSRKPSTRLDIVMNVLMLVIAMSVLGLGAWEVGSNTKVIANAHSQQA